MQVVLKDIVKASSIFITQIFSVVNFHQILYSSYFSSKPYGSITIIFAILFSIVYISKIFFLITELINLKNIQNETKSDNNKN